MTRKITLLLALLVVSMAIHAQFEKGKWVVDTSITGLELFHNTHTDRTSFGLEANGGAFVADNFALMVHGAARWNDRGYSTDVFSLGAGGRYYFSRTGIFTGVNINLDYYNDDDDDATKISLGLEAGYAFFLSRTVTIEPQVFWSVNDDYSRFGFKVGFGFYF